MDYEEILESRPVPVATDDCSVQLFKWSSGDMGGYSVLHASNWALRMDKPREELPCTVCDMAIPPQVDRLVVTWRGSNAAPAHICQRCIADGLTDALGAAGYVLRTNNCCALAGQGYNTHCKPAPKPSGGLVGLTQQTRPGIARRLWAAVKGVE